MALIGSWIVSSYAGSDPSFINDETSTHHISPASTLCLLKLGKTKIAGVENSVFMPSFAQGTVKGVGGAAVKYDFNCGLATLSTGTYAITSNSVTFCTKIVQNLKEGSIFRFMGTSGGRLLTKPDGTLKLNNAYNLLTSTETDNGNWIHLAIVSDFSTSSTASTGAVVYKNGIYMRTMPVKLNVAAGNMQILYDALPDYQCGASLAKFKIYNHAMSSAEVASEINGYGTFSTQIQCTISGEYYPDAYINSENNPTSTGGAELTFFRLSSTTIAGTCFDHWHIGNYYVGNSCKCYIASAVNTPTELYMKYKIYMSTDHSCDNYYAPTLLMAEIGNNTNKNVEVWLTYTLATNTLSSGTCGYYNSTGTRVYINLNTTFTDLTKGVWHDVKLHYLYSTGTTGTIQFWIDNNKILDVSTLAMTANLPTYVKIGNDNGYHPKPTDTSVSIAGSDFYKSIYWGTVDQTTGGIYSNVFDSAVFKSNLYYTNILN